MWCGWAQMGFECTRRRRLREPLRTLCERIGDWAPKSQQYATDGYSFMVEWLCLLLVKQYASICRRQRRVMEVGGSFGQA